MSRNDRDMLPVSRRRWLQGAGALAGLAVGSRLIGPALATTPPEPPALAEAVAAGELPPILERLPQPALVTLPRSPGIYGGQMDMFMASAKDTRVMVVYSYARLIGYDETLSLKPDLAQAVEVEDGRIFTIKLRANHRWSDGKPFTAECFRYFWEDVANDPDLSPSGPPQLLRVDGELPRVEFLDELTIRYSWSKPNADFLPALAATTPLYIYRPSHFLKKWHAKYADPTELEQMVVEAEQPSWAALHNKKDNMYKNDNPKQPTLDPWRLATKPPAERFVFERNPFYHRVDRQGLQLPYIDRTVFTIVDAKLIPAKVGAGEATLQSRNLRFDNYTFLKEGEARGDYAVKLWQSGAGSKIALYPNLNANDAVWRALFRDVRFRRALSLGIDRHEINQVIYYGLALEQGNCPVPESALFDEAACKSWTQYDPLEAGRLLDEIGLTARDEDGVRLLPDGRPMDLIVETAGESTEETDVLELIGDRWRQLGIRVFSKPSQREVFRNRVFAGETLMAIWTGLDNGIPTADTSPQELAPTSQQQLQWPKWGQFIETGAEAGEICDLPEAKRLLDLLDDWRSAADGAARQTIWQEMIRLYTDQVFVIGTVAGVPQPVVVKNGFNNLPERGIYNWDPGAHLGVYRLDSCWMAPELQAETAPAPASEG